MRAKRQASPPHTLRYYEKVSLLSGIQRSQGGIRQYTDADLEAIGLICCLKNTGISLQEITRYVELAHQGDQTLKERVALLRAHRETVIDRMQEMQKHLDKVTWKLNFYREKLKAYENGETEKA